jgi:hypothetical protein
MATAAGNDQSESSADKETDFHFRGDPARILYVDGESRELTVMRRRGCQTREETYADCFHIMSGQDQSPTKPLSVSWRIAD